MAVRCVLYNLYNAVYRFALLWSETYPMADSFPGGKWICVSTARVVQCFHSLTYVNCSSGHVQMALKSISARKCHMSNFRFRFGDRYMIWKLYQGPYEALKVLKNLEFDWTKFKALKSLNFTK